MPFSIPYSFIQLTDDTPADDEDEKIVWRYAPIMDEAAADNKAAHLFYTVKR